MTDSGTRPARCRSDFRAKILRGLLEFAGELFRALFNIFSHILCTLIKSFNITLDRVLDGFDIHFFAAHFEFFRSSDGFGQCNPEDNIGDNKGSAETAGKNRERIKVKPGVVEYTANNTGDKRQGKNYPEDPDVDMKIS